MSLSNSTKNTEKMIKISIANTPEEKYAVYRFRYSVYIEEMGLKLPAIDHNNKILFDELDDWGLTLYAQIGTEIIGTQRINIGPLPMFPQDLRQILCLDRFEQFHNRKGFKNFAYTSKLMVGETYRNSVAMYLLMVKAYELCCMHQVQFCFGICNFHLLRIYEQFGCQRFGRIIAAPGFDGVLTPVVLLIDDINHLRAVGSPLLRLARKRGTINCQAGEWFTKGFPQQTAIINSQLIAEEDFWQLLKKILKRNPQQAIPLLRGIPEKEARKFLHNCGVIIQCRMGDYIALSGYTSHTLNILLSGKIRSGNSIISLRKVNPGQFFGTPGLVKQTCCQEDICAVTDTLILVLIRFSFQKFAHSHPDIAGQIMQNITDSSTPNYNYSNVFRKTQEI